MFKYDPRKYLAFVLDEESRNLLISHYPFAYEKEYCHHVTLLFSGNTEKFNEVVKSLKTYEQEVFVNFLINDDGVQCFTIQFNNDCYRYDGNCYHLTHSVRKDKKPVDSNITIKKVLVPGFQNKNKIQAVNSIKITGKVEYLDK